MKTTGEKIKIKDLEEGMIIWSPTPDGYDILGISKCSIPKRYEENYCIKVVGNRFDYLLLLERGEPNGRNNVNL